MKSCNETRVLCKNNECIICYNKSFKSNSKYIYIVDKTLNPRYISKCSGKKTLFNCDKCNHIFQSTFDNISRGRWCPFCAIPSRKLCDKEDCTYCFNRSFASHTKSQYWNYENNDNIIPRNIFLNCVKKFNFICNNCNHNFNLSPNIINSQNQWCPYCTINQNKLCDNNDCNLCFNKSFASNPFSKFWNNKNTILPRQIKIKCDIKYLFNCESCNHTFSSRIADIKDNTNNCPYCSNKILCNDNDCEICYNKSFASFCKSKYWSIKNNITPRKVFKSTNTEYLFDCNICDNEFITSLDRISLRFQWCPICKNKTEKKLFEWFKSNNINIKYQCNKKWSEKTYIYDFILEEFNLIIELDGPQHFTQVSNWTSPDKTIISDINKIQNSLNNNYSIIHLLQENVLNNKNNWENKFKKYLIKYDKPTAIFINQNNIYNNHIDLLEKKFQLINDV